MLQVKKLCSKIYDRLLLSRYIVPFAKKNHDRIISTDNTLCLFCQPRGGSTWLAEILLHLPGAVLIDEPLWRGKMVNVFKRPEPKDRKVPRIADLDFFHNQPIPQNAQWPEATQVFGDIISGRIPSLGMYDEQDLGNLKNGHYYITKFNYANLLMPWLIGQYNFNSIVLTRHPCAIIASQLRLPGWCDLDSSNLDFDTFTFCEEYYQYLPLIGKIDSREKYLAFIWALGFKNTVMQPEVCDKSLIISYESLFTDFTSEINRINDRFFYNLNPDNIDHKRPSKSTISNSLANLRTTKQLSAWKQELSKNQVKNIMGVLEKFEIDIYTENIEPDYEKLYRKHDII